jgi:hypothetical protein
MTTRLLGLMTIAAVLASAVSGAGTQAADERKPAVTEPALTIEQALPLTCEQAWLAAGRRYAPMMAIVTTLAKVSLANRELTIPNTREAGLEAGKGIADDCKADPDALLFALVDKQVRRLGAPPVR